MRSDTKTLEELRLECRRLASQQTDDPATAFIDDDELDARINRQCRELWDLIILAYGHEDYGRSTRFETVVGQENYPLPEDFLQLVDIRVSTDGGVRWRGRLEAWQQHERTTLLNATSSIGRYRFRVGRLRVSLLPIPRVAGHLVEVDYVPVPARLEKPASTWDHGYTYWIECMVASGMAAQESNFELAQLRRGEADEVAAKLKRLADDRVRSTPLRIPNTRFDDWTRPLVGPDWGDDEVF